MRPRPPPNPASVEVVAAPDEALPLETPGLVHVVAAGETLFRIATNYGVTVEALQAANGISDATLIYAGQELIIPGVEPPQLALDLPASVVGIDLMPQLFVEGRTARLRVTTAINAAMSVEFLGTLPPVIAESPTSHVALLVVPLGTASEIYPLTLTVTPADGGAVDTVSLNIQVVAGGYGSQFITLPGDRAALVDIGIEQNEVNILTGVMTFNP
ncbi:LysM peptidoglycan-binding domain-containing protein [bacterium]|nr:LysM peptidoglycan-binding domain-containing protein [bacterium]